MSFAKKASDAKYPHSASLFQFCRLVLDHKFGGIRVIDQDVGQILGFDPADCSHWKKGKKNIRSIQAMKSIAEHLGVDERLIVDVAAGEQDEHEAFFEFTGYGSFEVDQKVLETARKDFYRKNASTWTRDKEMEFKGLFDPNEVWIDNVVKEIHAKINFGEAPLYLPEVAAHYPNIKLLATEATETLTEARPVQAIDSPGGVEVRYLAGLEMRPYVRYRIARAMAPAFLTGDQNPSRQDLGEFAQHVIEIQRNLFAAKLLVPANLLRKEMANINVGKDIVVQLAETFWVSKTLMNRRLKEILERQSAI